MFKLWRNINSTFLASSAIQWGAIFMLMRWSPWWSRWEKQACFHFSNPVQNFHRSHLLCCCSLNNCFVDFTKTQTCFLTSCHLIAKAGSRSGWEDKAANGVQTLSSHLAVRLQLNLSFDSLSHQTTYFICLELRDDCLAIPNSPFSVPVLSLYFGKSRHLGFLVWCLNVEVG